MLDNNKVFALKNSELENRCFGKGIFVQIVFFKLKIFEGLFDKNYLDYIDSVKNYWLKDKKDKNFFNL